MVPGLCLMEEEEEEEDAKKRRQKIVKTERSKEIGEEAMAV